MRRRQKLGEPSQAARDLFAKSDPKIEKKAKILAARDRLFLELQRTCREIVAEDTRRLLRFFAKPNGAHWLARLNDMTARDLYELAGRPKNKKLWAEQTARESELHFGMKLSADKIRKALNPSSWKD